MLGCFSFEIMIPFNTATEPFQTYKASTETIAFSELPQTIAEVIKGVDYRAVKRARLVFSKKGSMTGNYSRRLSEYSKSSVASDQRTFSLLKLEPDVVEKAYAEIESCINDWHAILEKAFPEAMDLQGTEPNLHGARLKITDITEWLRKSANLQYLHVVQSKHYLSCNPFLTKKNRPVVRSTSDSTKWPWGTHETNLLRCLEAVAKRWWADYEPDQPNSAPRNVDIDEWIQADFAPSMTKNMREAVITILRADSAPVGRRPKGAK